MGRIFQMPSDHARLAVRERVISGATEDDISAYLNMPVKRVKKLFRREFQEAAAEAARGKSKVDAGGDGFAGEAGETFRPTRPGNPHRRCPLIREVSSFVAVPAP